MHLLSSENRLWNVFLRNYDIFRASTVQLYCAERLHSGLCLEHLCPEGHFNTAAVNIDVYKSFLWGKVTHRCGLMDHLRKVKKTNIFVTSEWACLIRRKGTVNIMYWFLVYWKWKQSLLSTQINRNGLFPVYYLGVLMHNYIIWLIWFCSHIQSNTFPQVTVDLNLANGKFTF